MIALAQPSSARETARENAARIAVVAALSATSMLFASLGSAYLVRRSFPDWRPAPAIWPLFLLALGFCASAAIEIAARSDGRRQRRALRGLALASGLYLVGALGVLLVLATASGGLSTPHRAFVVLLLGVHLLHAVLGGAFSLRLLPDVPSGVSQTQLVLARLVTHFLTALLVGIFLLLFVLQ